VPSFKLKLFVYFLVLGVLPLAVATLAVTRVEERTAARANNARLAAEVRAALASYRRELEAAAAPARRLARSSTLADRLREHHVLFVDRNGSVLSRRPPRAATRPIAVMGPRGRIGTVVVAVPLDRIGRDAGLPPGDRLELTRSGRLVVRTPAAASDHTATSELLAALAAALLLAGLIAYFEGRAIVRTIGSLVGAANEIARGRLEQRVAVRGHDELATLGRAFNTMAGELETRLAELEDERARLRQVVSGFGAALAATHDVVGLVRVILETAVEATGAAGGTFVGTDTAVLDCGDREAHAERLELSVEGHGGHFGVLTLFGAGFDEESVATAGSIVSQAVVALENEQLHRIVAHQAMTDSLTGLANRRRCEEALRSELAHVRRFGGSLAVVLADLDEFKRLNDTYGHAAGDAVLRDFGDLLCATIRASDVAGRWGGEEFVLLLRETDLDGAWELAERLRNALAGRTIFAPNGERLAVTASFGVATYDVSDTEADVVAAADEALYAAKRGGRNRVSARATSLAAS